ncbi:zinc ABC transporter substrate-binding protein [Roseibium salinum]|nr:zinc ABC transporter substrate-binding protein [Roseibium salinum]
MRRPTGKNAAKFTSRIETLEQEIRAELEPLSDKKFVVFHDAYHHFEHHFEIEASGSVTVSPEALSSADRVAAIQDRIKELGVVCVFQEPQFDAKLVDVVLEGSNARKGTLDPLGTDLANGPDLYPQLLEKPVRIACRLPQRPVLNQKNRRNVSGGFFFSS